MNIDAHQHFWNYDPAKHTWITDELAPLKSDFLPDDLAPILHENNFDGCVAVQAEQSEGESEFLLSLAEEHDIVKGVVGWVDLRAGNSGERLDFFKENSRFKGVRHIVQDEPDNEFLLRKDFQHGIKALGDRSLTYDILVFPKQLPAALEFVKIFDNQKMVIDHLAKPDIKTGNLEDWEGYIREIGRNEHVYCKLSGMVTEASWTDWKKGDFEKYFDIIMEVYGSSRLMIGSDWPVCLLAAEYSQAISLVTDYIENLSETEKQNIMGQTAVEFYNL